MRLVLVSLVAALALAGTSSAQNPPGAEQACQQALKTLGEKGFAQAFGSLDGCLATLGGVIQSATAECTAKGLDKGTPELKACVQDRVRAAIKEKAGAGGGAKKTDEQAQKTCAQLQEKLGAKFEQRYGSLDACVAETTKAMSVCAKETKPGSAEFKQCVQQRLKSDGKATGDKTAEHARKTCTQLQEKLGAKFEQRYGSLDACVAETTKAMSACAKETKPGSDEFKQCLQARSKESGKKSGKESGKKSGKESGRDAGAKSAEQAQKTCAQLQEKLGAKFEERYGSLQACVTEAAKALSACAKETKPGSAEFKQCVQQRLSRR